MQKSDKTVVKNHSAIFFKELCAHIATGYHLTVHAFPIALWAKKISKEAKFIILFGYEICFEF